MAQCSPPPAPPPNAAREIVRMLLVASIGRCRAAGVLCRLSISLKCFHDLDPPSTKISISDTGVGSSIDEFQHFVNLLQRLPPSGAAKWVGVLFVATTCIGDKEIYRYRLDLREASVATQLSSTPKNGRKFSGTEATISVECIEAEGIVEFAEWVTDLVCEAAILRTPSVAFLLEIEHLSNWGPKTKSIPLKSFVQSSPRSSIECLVSGLEDYVLRHGKALHETCQSCFPNRENLKVGRGITSSRQKGDMVDAVIVIAEVSGPPENSCSQGYIMKNEALYFYNHLPSAMVESPWCALKSIHWQKYGFSLEPDHVNGDGHIGLKCENLPRSVKIVIAIHYHKKKFIPLEGNQKIAVEQNLVRKAVTAGLDDLKVKYKGFFLSQRALKIQKHVPDLSQTIAGLILSSSDQDFQYECASLLGIQPLDIRVEGKVEACIQQKIFSIIEMNDSNKNTRESSACLFEWDDDRTEESNDEDEELSDMDV